MCDQDLRFTHKDASRSHPPHCSPHEFLFLKITYFFLMSVFLKSYDMRILSPVISLRIEGTLLNTPTSQQVDSLE